jgi:uncharacterized protein YceK
MKNSRTFSALFLLSILFIVALLMSGCGIEKVDSGIRNQPYTIENKIPQKEIRVYDDENRCIKYFYTINIDGCEYIFQQSYASVVHKANCTNSIHFQKQ